MASRLHTYIYFTSIIYKSYLQFHVHGLTYSTFHITQNQSSHIRLLWSAARDQLNSSSLFIVTALYITIVHGGYFPPSILRRLSPVRQCACLMACILNIDCTRQFENNNFWQVIQYPSDNYNPFRTYNDIPQNPTLPPPPPPTHKRALNKEQFWGKTPLATWQANPNIQATWAETI